MGISTESDRALEAGMDDFVPKGCVYIEAGMDDFVPKVCFYIHFALAPLGVCNYVSRACVHVAWACFCESVVHFALRETALLSPEWATLFQRCVFIRVCVCGICVRAPWFRVWLCMSSMSARCVPNVDHTFT